MKTWKRSIASLVWSPRGVSTPCTLSLDNSMNSVHFGWFNMNCCPLSCCFVGLRKRVLRHRETLQMEGEQQTTSCFVQGLVVVLYFSWLCLLLSSQNGSGWKGSPWSHLAQPPCSNRVILEFSQTVFNAASHAMEWHLPLRVGLLARYDCGQISSQEEILSSSKKKNSTMQTELSP